MHHGSLRRVRFKTKRWVFFNGNDSQLDTIRFEPATLWARHLSWPCRTNTPCQPTAKRDIHVPSRVFARQQPLAVGVDNSLPTVFNLFWPLALMQQALEAIKKVAKYPEGREKLTNVRSTPPQRNGARHAQSAGQPGTRAKRRTTIGHCDAALPDLCLGVEDHLLPNASKIFPFSSSPSTLSSVQHCDRRLLLLHRQRGACTRHRSRRSRRSHVAGGTGHRHQ